MNYFKTTNGERISKATIDRNVRKTKEAKIYKHMQLYGYMFCTECRRNDCNPIDCAHIISVDECQKTGRSELAWDLDNIKIIGRRHHQKIDGLDLKSQVLLSGKVDNPFIYMKFAKLCIKNL